VITDFKARLSRSARFQNAHSQTRAQRLPRQHRLAEQRLRCAQMSSVTASAAYFYRRILDVGDLIASILAVEKVAGM